MAWTDPRGLPFLFVTDSSMDGYVPTIADTTYFSQAGSTHGTTRVGGRPWRESDIFYDDHGVSGRIIL